MRFPPLRSGRHGPGLGPGRRPFDHFLDCIRLMLIVHSGKLILRIPIGDQACNLSAPTQMGLRKIVRGHLKVAGRGIDATEHDLVVENQLPDQFGARNLERPVASRNAGVPCPR